MSGEKIVVVVELKGESQQISVFSTPDELTKSLEDFGKDVPTKLYWLDDEEDWILFSQPIQQEEFDDAVEMSNRLSRPIHVRIGDSQFSETESSESSEDMEGEENLKGGSEEKKEEFDPKIDPWIQERRRRKVHRIETLTRKLKNLEKEVEECGDDEKKSSRLKRIVERRTIFLEKSKTRLIVFDRRSAERKKSRFPRRQRKHEKRSRRHRGNHGGRRFEVEKSEPRKKYDWRNRTRKRKVKDLPVPKDQKIEFYYLDGNNMMYMSNSLRQHKPWTREGMKTVSELITLTSVKFKDVQSEIDIHLVFDDHRREELEKKKLFENKISVYCARPQYKTADDYIVEMLQKHEDEGDGSNMVVVTSDVELIGRLKSAKEKVWIESPSTWLKKVIRCVYEKDELEKGDTDRFFSELK